MLKNKRVNFISGLAGECKHSRYDYKKIAVDYNSIAVGSEDNFKESR